MLTYFICSLVFIVMTIGLFLIYKKIWHKFKKLGDSEGKVGDRCSLLSRSSQSLTYAFEYYLFHQNTTLKIILHMP